MSRSLSAAILTALGQPSLLVGWFCQLDLPGGMRAYCTDAKNHTVGAVTYEAVGTFGAVEPIEEDADLIARPMRISLSALDSVLMPEILAADYRGRSMTVLFGLFDDNHDLVDDPVPYWTGHISETEIEVEENGTATVRITGEQPWAEIDKTNGSLYTPERHQMDFPGDRFFEFLSSLADGSPRWSGGKAPRYINEGRRPGSRSWR